MGQRRAHIRPTGFAAFETRRLGTVRIIELQDRRLSKSIAGAARHGMVRVAFKLDRSACNGLAQHGLGNTAKRDGGGVPSRHAWRQIDRLTDRRHCLFRGLATGGQPRHGDGRCHQLQETPSIHQRRHTCKFRLYQCLSVRGLGKRLKPAPISLSLKSGQLFTQNGEVQRLTHRWHVPQSVRPRVSMCRAVIRRSPNWRRSSEGLHCILVTCSRGRRWGAGSR